MSLRLLAAAATAALTVAGPSSTAPSNLAFSTYFGTTGNDTAFMAAAAPDGGAFVAGSLYQGHAQEAYVSRYAASPPGLDWTTVLSATGSINGYYVRADSTAVYLVGLTTAPDLPAASNHPAAKVSAFIAVLDPATGTLLDSTYLDPGAAGVDAVDPATGDVYVGEGLGAQAAVLKLDPSATTVLWKVMVGHAPKGTSSRPLGLQVTPSGGVAVAVMTDSPAYPTTAGAAQPSPGGGYDVAVTEYDSSGSLLWSTYLGGSGNDRPNGLDVDPSGNVDVTGQTTSTDFPLLNPLPSQAPPAAGDPAGFVTSFAPDGTLRYSTYLGDGAWFGGVAAAADGTAWVVGGTSSGALPVVGGAPPTRKVAKGDAYIAALAPDGSAVTYSTYLGGSALDGAAGIALVPGGEWVVGRTASSDFPLVNPTYSSNAGGFDAWIALLSGG